MKYIKLINDNLKTTDNKIYLCIWNGGGDGEIVEEGTIIEIHTINSLLENYLDIMKKYKLDIELAYSGLTWSKLFKKLDNFESHLEDNMYIKRIK